MEVLSSREAAETKWGGVECLYTENSVFDP